MSNKKKSQCLGKDVFSRMNFLYQISITMAGKSDVLSAYYGNLCKSVGKKSVLRMEPNIKRTMCKRCGIAFKPNTTANLNFNDNKNKEEHMHLTCKKCGFNKNYSINSKYKLWLENENSIIEKYHASEIDLK